MENLKNISITKLKEHLIFLKGYSEAWERCIEFESFSIEGAADILMNYYDIHELPLMSADELIAEIEEIIYN